MALRIAEGLRGVPPVSIRAAKGANGGVPFLVTISRRATFSLAQLQAHLETMSQRLKAAPYYSYVREKQVDIWIVSRQDLIELSLYKRIPAERTECDAPPEQTVERVLYPAAQYSPEYNAVIICSEEVADKGVDVQELIMHEFLHAYSASPLKKLKDGHASIRGGIYVSIGREDTREETSSEARELNEGLTEYLRFRANGKSPVGQYLALSSCISILVQYVGEEVFFDAYFNGKIDRLKTVIEEKYGAKAYKELDMLAGYLFDLHSTFTTKFWENRIVGFARFGYEYYAMQEWGYSHENRERAPRQLQISELSSQIRNVIEGRRFKVFTNLNGEELIRFFDNMLIRQKYLMGDALQWLEDISRYVDKQSDEWHLEIIYADQRYERYSRPVKIEHAQVRARLINLSDLKQPNFLGRPASELPLCHISLE